MAPSHIIISPGPCSPVRGRDLDRRGPAARRHHSDPGRLPGTPVHRGRLRRRDRPRGAADARQDVDDPPPGRGHLPWPPRPVPRDALPLAGDRSRLGAGRAGGHGHLGGRRDHGRPAPPASRPRRAVPSRVRAHRAWIPPGRSLPAWRSRVAPGRCRSRRMARWCPPPPSPARWPRTRRRWTWCGDHRIHRDVDGPGRRDQLRAHGRRVGRGAHRPQALSRDDDVPERARDPRGGGQPDRRRHALRAGGDRQPAVPLGSGHEGAGAVLEAACSWRELEVVSIDDTPPRSRIETRVVYQGTRREFLGFNRARHAVLEAAILATRTHLIPADEIRAEFARLQVIVDKTAGPREREAMAMLTEYVAVAIASSSRRAARLHFGVLDLRGALGRRFGGLGAAVPAPSLLLEATPRSAAERPRTRCRADAAFCGAVPHVHHGRSAGARLTVHRSIPTPQRPGLRHAARIGRGPGAGRAVRAAHRAGGAGPGGRPGPPVGHRDLDICAGRLHRGGWSAARGRRRLRRCWPALPSPSAGGALWPCRRARPG